MSSDLKNSAYHLSNWRKTGGLKSPIPRPERFLVALLRVDPDRRTTAAGCELIVKSGGNCLDGGAPDFRHRGAAFIGAPVAKLVSCFLRCHSR
jgi:hypothetical protein